MGRPVQEPCVGCVVFKTLCNFGTTKSGYCIECNARAPQMRKNFDPGLEYNGFFDAEMQSLFFNQIKVNLDWNQPEFHDYVDMKFSSSIVRIKLVDNTGSWDDPSHRSQVDEVVQSFFGCEVGARYFEDGTRTIFRDAVLACQHLNFLVAEQADERVAENLLIEGLQFKITHMIMYRVNHLIANVRREISNIWLGKDGWLDALGATGLLCIMLTNVLDGIENGSLTPLWIDSDFRRVLVRRLHATVQELNMILDLRSLCCNNKWSASFDGNVKGFFDKMMSNTTELSIKRYVKCAELVVSSPYSGPSTSSTLANRNSDDSFGRNGFTPIITSDTMQTLNGFQSNMYYLQNPETFPQGESSYQCFQNGGGQPDYSWTRASSDVKINDCDQAEPTAMGSSLQRSVDDAGAQFDAVPLSYNLVQYGSPPLHHTAHYAHNNNNHLSAPMSGIPGSSWDIQEGMKPDVARSYRRNLCFTRSSPPSFDFTYF